MHLFIFLSNIQPNVGDICSTLYDTKNGKITPNLLQKLVTQVAGSFATPLRIFLVESVFKTLLNTEVMDAFNLSKLNQTSQT